MGGWVEREEEVCVCGEREITMHMVYMYIYIKCLIAKSS